MRALRLQHQRRDQGEGSIDSEAERERQDTIAHDVADPQTHYPEDGKGPERLDHVGRTLAPGDGHGYEPLVDPEGLRRRDHDRTLHDPVPTARRNKEADDVGRDERPEGEGVLVREREEPVGDHRGQSHAADREGHEALYPTVERVLQGDGADGSGAAGKRPYVTYRGPVQDQTERQKEGNDGVEVERERARHDRAYEVGDDSPGEDQVQRPETLELAGRRVGVLCLVCLVFSRQKVAVDLAHLLGSLGHHPPVERYQRRHYENHGQDVPPSEYGVPVPQNLARLLLDYVRRAPGR